MSDEVVRKRGGPATFGELVQDMALSPEEEAVLEQKKSAAADRGFSSVEDFEADERRREVEAAKSPLAMEADNPTSATEVPPWAIVPPTLRFPVGRAIGFFRFPSKWTTRPDKGLVDPNEKDPRYADWKYRQCIVWTLSIADEKLARVDARGDALAFVPEMAKRMIRAVDGNVVDWSTGAVNREQAVSAGTGASVATGRETHVPTFWEEIGPSFRQLVINHFHKTHTLDPEQAAYFFMRCYAVRSGRPG